jgi:hypothetical protein
MRRSNAHCRSLPAASRLLAPALALLLVAADGPKQTIDARGLTFQVPASWKSSPPTSQMRVAQLKVDPIEGDDYPAEMVVTVFRPSAGPVDANLRRWQGMFKDRDGNPPTIESKKIKGKNIEVTRAETAGHYYPAQFSGRPEPDRPDARFLGAIVTGDGVTYYIRMVGPNRTMTKLRPDFDELLSTIKVEER